MDQDARLTKALLATAAILTVACLALAGYITWSKVRGVSWERLSVRERLALVDQMQRTSPPVFREYLFSGSPGFYHMVPGQRYENVDGASFTTNELGFRAPTGPAPSGVKRALIAGDSWTFGPFVPPEETWGSQLERLLNQGGARWQVYNLSMVGWNAGNLLAALQQLLPVVRPDLVILCPTPNDIDDRFAVWDGRLVTQGFASQGIFRHAYATERRWVDTLRQMNAQLDRIEGRGIPTLTYFLADWEGLVPYYAKLADFRPRYIAQPPDYLKGEYRLPGSIDPGEHATVAGHSLIANYLFNALIAAQFVDGAPVELDRAVDYPGHTYDPAFVEGKLAEARTNAIEHLGPQMFRVDPDFMLDRGIYSFPAVAGQATVRVTLGLIDDPWLYPLDVEIRLEADEPVVETRHLESFVDGKVTIELTRPESVRDYDFVDLTVHASRTTFRRDRGLAVSMRHPQVELSP
jgi:hypothetical protein